MENTFEQLSNQPENSLVLDHLSGQNAHSDLACFFFERLRELNKAATYAPDGYPFPYTLAHANHLIFGFCVGMQAISLKLPDHLTAMALKDGGKPNNALASNGWLDFLVFDPSVKPDHDRWIKHAYREALK